MEGSELASRGYGSLGSSVLHTAVLTSVASLKETPGLEAPLLPAAHLSKAMQMRMDARPPIVDSVHTGSFPFTCLLPFLLSTHLHLLSLGLSFLLTPHPVPSYLP